MSVLLALALLAAAAPDSAPLHLRAVVEGLDRPVVVTTAGDGSGRLFIAEQGGTIRIFDGAQLLPRPFLDISALVSRGMEQGLLGLAFHPDFETNGLFYVNYTDRTGDTRIVRYALSPDDGNVADPESGVLVLGIEQPFANHNGGQILFGPDGRLWTGTGDGGSAGDPFGNGQNPRALLGKILRMDVDFGLPAAPEIWALGLRNPWRFTFDRLTGDLFIGDVGQNQWEEIDFEPAGAGPGRNYGWRLMEASQCFLPQSRCDNGALTLPVLEYSHDEGCSVTGGYRYRGTSMPGHLATYFFGDFCSGRVWGGRQDEETGAWTRTELLDSPHAVSTFGEDENGELYLADLQGSVYRLHGDTFCNVRLSQRTYRQDETVRSTLFEVANFSDRTVAVEIEIRPEVGADRSLVLPAGFSQEEAPVDLFGVSSSTPRGPYALVCRFIDPETELLLSTSALTFFVE
jgi:glucose/arabinose dehydrogenase